MDKGTAVAGVFTNRMPVAPVEMVPRQLGRGGSSKGGFARALVVNSGNANASPARPGAGDGADGLDRRQGARGGPNEGVPRLHRRDREPLDATKFNGVLGTLASPPC